MAKRTTLPALVDDSDDCFIVCSQRLDVVVRRQTDDAENALSCPLCGRSLAGLCYAAVQQHANSCADKLEAEAGTELLHCSSCGRTLSYLQTPALRRAHVATCTLAHRSAPPPQKTAPAGGGQHHSRGGARCGAAAAAAAASVAPRSTPSQLASFLERFGVGSPVAIALSTARVSLSLLPHVTDGDLRRLGVAGAADRRRVLAAGARASLASPPLTAATTLRRAPDAAQHAPVVSPLTRCGDDAAIAALNEALSWNAVVQHTLAAAAPVWPAWALALQSCDMVAAGGRRGVASALPPLPVRCEASAARIAWGDGRADPRRVRSCVALAPSRLAAAGAPALWRAAFCGREPEAPPPALDSHAGDTPCGDAAPPVASPAAEGDGGGGGDGEGDAWAVLPPNVTLRKRRRRSARPADSDCGAPAGGDESDGGARWRGIDDVDTF